MSYNQNFPLMVGRQVDYKLVPAFYINHVTNLLNAGIDFAPYGDEYVKLTTNEPSTNDYVDNQTPKYEHLVFAGTSVEDKKREVAVYFEADQIKKQRRAVEEKIPYIFPMLYSVLSEDTIGEYLKILADKLPFGGDLSDHVVPWNYMPWKQEGMTVADSRGISFKQIERGKEIIHNATKHTGFSRMGSSSLANGLEFVCVLPRALKKYLEHDKDLRYTLVGVNTFSLGLKQFGTVLEYPICENTRFLFVDDDIWLKSGLHTENIDGANHEGVYALLGYTDASRFVMNTDTKFGTKPAEEVVTGVNGSASLGFVLRGVTGGGVDCIKGWVRIDCNIGNI